MAFCPRESLPKASSRSLHRLIRWLVSHQSQPPESKALLLKGKHTIGLANQRALKQMDHPQGCGPCQYFNSLLCQFPRQDSPISVIINLDVVPRGMQEG